MSDLIIWARIIEESASQFLVVVSSAAATAGHESQAFDIRTAEAKTHREAVMMRDTMVAAMTQAIEHRGHRVASVGVLNVARTDKASHDDD